MKKLIVSVASFLLLTLYKLFSLFPTRNRIACLSRQSNQAPIDFLLLKTELERINSPFKAIILAKTLDNKILYCLHIIKQVYYIATSKAVVLDSYCIPVSLLDQNIKAPVVQMWHAMGNMKKFGYTAIGTEEGRSKSEAALFKMHRGYDAVLISSKNFIADYAAGFGVDPSIILEAPLPKTDLLIDPDYRKAKCEEIYSEFPDLRLKKNICYCPTFRRNASKNESLAMANLLNAINFEKYNFIHKPHPISTQKFNDPRVLEDYGAFDMLYIADYIISDYSTVIYEAGLLDIPIYLYGYDWNEYRQKRSLNINIEHDIPALFTNDPETIIQAIESNAFDHQAYQHFMRENITIPSGKTCTQQVLDIIFSMIR